ncbi:MAG: hypothetical protein ABSG90_06760 [Dehalococcoidia bacterium]|jgi:hypothetical protein
MENKSDIRSDTAKNRLYLILAGTFDDSEMKQIADKTIVEVKKLRPGFDIINDISECKPATLKGIEEIKRAQLAIKEGKVKRVIRIVGQSVTEGQFVRKSQEVGYDADTARSIAEAEKMLAA